MVGKIHYFTIRIYRSTEKGDNCQPKRKKNAIAQIPIIWTKMMLIPQRIGGDFSYVYKSLFIHPARMFRKLPGHTCECIVCQPKSIDYDYSFILDFKVVITIFNVLK